MGSSRVLVLSICFVLHHVGNGFVPSQSPPRTNHVMALVGDEAPQTLRDEAKDLLSKAKQLRSEIGGQGEEDSVGGAQQSVLATKVATASPWSVISDEEGDEYRLYLDIGREEGTWMDRRWGASGRRISLTLDVKFLSVPASESASDKMVKDNFGGRSSATYVIAAAKVARLRDGFEKMQCNGGCYRIDSGGGSDTLRFYLDVAGTIEEQGYGDVSIPACCLYFSLPCFGGKTSQLSTKEGIVTVRQIGWNTGWRREESRIVGTLYAKPIDAARKKSRF